MALKVCYSIYKVDPFKINAS